MDGQACWIHSQPIPTRPRWPDALFKDLGEGLIKSRSVRRRTMSHRVNAAVLRSVIADNL
eukprot:1142115-Amphidinium_carterae.1